MKYKEYCEIINKKIEGNYLTIQVKTQKIARECSAGQFVNIRASETLDPLLRRPISICDADGDLLTLMILIKGKGTRMLSGKETGETLNIIGPLGNGFPKASGNRKALFVAGGVGAAPFLHLARSIPGATMLFGARSKNLLPDLSEFSRRMEVKIATDDGSAGQKGTVIDLLVQLDLTQYTIYACGPNPMFRAMNKVFQSCGDIEAYYSLETMMGCGFGACKGCTVETPSGEYKLSCTDGPVFRWNEVKI